MQERKAINIDDLLDSFYEKYKNANKSMEAFAKLVIQFCREADPVTAERAVTHKVFTFTCKNIKDGEENIYFLLLRKVITNKTPEQLLLFLIDLLTRYQVYPDVFNELKQVFFAELKSNLEFRKYFIASQSSRRIEILLIQYCSDHQDDKGMQELLAEYQKFQNTPEMKKRHQIDHEDAIREIYGFPKNPHPLTSYQNDIVQIAVFLSYPERMLLRLKELEALIESKARENSQIEVGDEKSSQPLKLKGYIEGKPFNGNKLLSSVLYKLAKEFGFEEAQKIYPGPLLSSQEFYKILKEKRLIKDVTLGDATGHGEWVHFIQWICIALESRANSHFIINPVASIYEWIGKQAESPDRIKHLWLYTFDGEHGRPWHTPMRSVLESGTNTTLLPKDSELDFRYADEFYRYLLTSAEATAHLPLLQQLLNGRVLKRMQQRKDDDVVTTLQSLCANHSKNKIVTELKASLETINKAVKPIKSAKLLQTFGVCFHKVEKQLPPEFVTEVMKQLPFGVRYE